MDNPSEQKFREGDRVKVHSAGHPNNQQEGVVTVITIRDMGTAPITVKFPGPRFSFFWPRELRPINEQEDTK